MCEHLTKQMYRKRGGSVVSTVIGLRAGLSWFRNPGRDKRLYPQNVPPGYGGAPSTYSIGYRNPLPEAKRPGHEVDHSPPSSTKVQNEWSYTSTPSTCLRGVNRKLPLLL